MTRPTRPAQEKDQLRPSRAARQLREALGLSPDDWESFLWHARCGFADFEQAHYMDPEEALTLWEVPAEWLRDPAAIGYVLDRVVRDGKPGLAAPVARYFFEIYRPGNDFESAPPGIGQAWLQMARHGLRPPAELSRLVDQALDDSKSFFYGVAEHDLPFVSRLVLEARGTIEAPVLHALFAAVDRAQIHVRAPFRLFDTLMAENWLSVDLKREFCRGLLQCEPELNRLRQWSEAFRASVFAEPEKLYRFPQCWADVLRAGVAWRVPGLARHAVGALVENLGEPLDDVIGEFFLRQISNDPIETGVSIGVLDLIARRAEELGPKRVKKHLAMAIKRGRASVRQAAYRIGAKEFGLEFVQPAMEDRSGLVRNWAAKLLQTKKR